MNRQKLKQAFAGMDEINTFWVDKMQIPDNEKLLRVQMMNDFQKQISEIPPVEKTNDTEKWLLLLALAGLTYKTIYLNIVDRYFPQYVKLISNSTHISDFSQAWINNHADDFALYTHDSTPQTIARTEVNAMCGMAQLDGYVQAGYTHKTWNTMSDKKVRKSHQYAAGQTVLLEEPFRVGDSLMMFPLDTSLGASAKEIVNCRCSMAPVK